MQADWPLDGLINGAALKSRTEDDGRRGEGKVDDCGRRLARSTPCGGSLVLRSGNIGSSRLTTRRPWSSMAVAVAMAMAKVHEACRLMNVGELGGASPRASTEKSRGSSSTGRATE